jgi:hypothetical protein
MLSPRLFAVEEVALGAPVPVVALARGRDGGITPEWASVRAEDEGGLGWCGGHKDLGHPELSSLDGGV